MNELEIRMKEGCEQAIKSIEKDFDTDRSPFMGWLQPLLDVLSGLAFFLYQRGFEDGMLYKETNEPTEVQ